MTFDFNDYWDSRSGLKMDFIQEWFLGVTTIFIMFGGTFPFLFQYREIQKSQNPRGFSLYVCFTLLSANILRIMFWLGKRYETQLLVQSFVMICCMLMLVELTVRTKRSQLKPGQTVCSIWDSDFCKNFWQWHDFSSYMVCISALASFLSFATMLFIHSNFQTVTFAKTSGSGTTSPATWSASLPWPPSSALPRCYSSIPISDSDFCKNFWQWHDFSSYMVCISALASFLSFATMLFIHSNFYVEVIGALALLLEALLGAPQFIKNYQRGSTYGMSIRMVLMWLTGDISKVIYFILRKTPPQFWVCGLLQISMDLAILSQVFYYRLLRRSSILPTAATLRTV